MTAPRRAAARRPAFERLPLLLLGFVALAAGTGAGLARLAFKVVAGAPAQRVGDVGGLDFVGKAQFETVYDFALASGVLYHLPDMLRALHAVRSVCHGTLFLETHSENDFCPDIAAARYYQGASLAGDITNFWSPNRLCVLDMLRDAGFVPNRDDAWGDRLMVEARAAEDFGKLRIAYGNFPA